MMNITYFKNGCLDPTLVTSQAQDVAKKFDNPADRVKLNQSQLRKFYSEVKTLERRWRSNKDAASFLEVLPLIKLLKAKSNYAEKRQVAPSIFREWMWTNVDMVNTEEDFKAFLLHFEAVVGFAYKNK